MASISRGYSDVELSRFMGKRIYVVSAISEFLQLDSSEFEIVGYMYVSEDSFALVGRSVSDPQLYQKFMPFERPKFWDVVGGF